MELDRLINAVNKTGEFKGKKIGFKLLRNDLNNTP